jgi:hypothetical protein
MDKPVVANERGSQIALYIRTPVFSKKFLGTWCRGELCDYEIV